MSPAIVDETSASTATSTWEPSGNQVELMDQAHGSLQSKKSVACLTLVFLYIIVVIMIIRETKARPGGEWASANGCNNGDTSKIEICQRCAKQTKSPIVYPMCCNEEEEVHHWCYRYTTYGKEA